MKKLIGLVLLFCFSLSFLTPVEAAPKPSMYDVEAKTVYDSSQNINVLLKAVKKKRDGKFEMAVKRDYVDYLVKGITGLSDYGRAFVYFIAYGTPSTQRLGYEERSGLLNSYKNAFNKIPLSKGDWAEVLRIANGTKPMNKSVQAEQKALTEFRKAYNREPLQKGDEIAIYIMAYGIRPLKKDSAREKAALAHFKKIYGFEPVYGYHWDVLRAYAYSGVKY